MMYFGGSFLHTLKQRSGKNLSPRIASTIRTLVLDPSFIE